MNWTTVPLILWLQRQLSMRCHLSAAVSGSHMTLSFLGHMFYNHMLALFSAQAPEWQSKQSHLGDPKHRRQEVQWRNSHPLSIHYLSEMNKSFLWPTRRKIRSAFTSRCSVYVSETIEPCRPQLTNDFQKLLNLYIFQNRRWYKYILWMSFVIFSLLSMNGVCSLLSITTEMNVIVFKWKGVVAGCQGVTLQLLRSLGIHVAFIWFKITFFFF